MTRQFTEEQRLRQADVCRQHRPWQFSSGPRTQRGKQASAQNARKPATAQQYLFLIEIGQHHAARLVWRRLFRYRRSG